ncbi:MAG: hypothetical protein IGQ88_02970 [Gloeomargaritaceae cyanobacterium C42_A2020_066]|nr:hypothetical protein [Gloeomargaritaceae cyanobacterium C42_A2020_066]
MFPHEYRQFAPQPALINYWLESHALAARFRHEVEVRQEHERYCRWYHQVAAEHRREMGWPGRPG